MPLTTDWQLATAKPRVVLFQKLPAVSVSVFDCGFPVLRDAQAVRNAAADVTRQVRERAVAFLQEPLAPEPDSRAGVLVRRLHAENKQMRALLAIHRHPLVRRITEVGASEQMSSSQASRKEFEAEQAASAAAAAKSAEDISELRRQLEAERAERAAEAEKSKEEIAQRAAEAEKSKEEIAQRAAEAAKAKEEIARLRKELEDLCRVKDKHATEHLVPG